MTREELEFCYKNKFKLRNSFWGTFSEIVKIDNNYAYMKTDRDDFLISDTTKVNISHILKVYKPAFKKIKSNKIAKLFYKNCPEIDGYIIVED